MCTHKTLTNLKLNLILVCVPVRIVWAVYALSSLDFFFHPRGKNERKKERGSLISDLMPKSYGKEKGWKRLKCAAKGLLEKRATLSSQKERGNPYIFDVM